MRNALGQVIAWLHNLWAQGPINSDNARELWPVVQAAVIFIIFVGFRLMGYGTLQLIWNGELKDRVMAYLGALEAANAK